MAKFYENILKPEEQYGSYNVGEPDDDTFSLKEADYPEDINEYISIEDNDEELTENIEEVIVKDNNQDEKEEIQEQEKTIWDEFEEKNVDDIIQEETSVEPQLFQTEANVEDEIVSIDEDLKSLISESLNKSKTKKVEDEIEIKESEIITEPIDFKPVEEVTDTEYIDITNIDTSRPSEKTEQKITQEPKNKELDLEDIKNESILEEKEKKKLSIWKILAISSAAILFIELITYLILIYLIPKSVKKEEIAKKDTISKVEKEEIPKKEDKDTSIIKEKEANKDIAKQEEKIVEKRIEKSIDKEVEKPKNIIPEKKVVKDKEKIIGTKPIEKVEKNIIPKKPKIVEPSKEPKIIEQPKKEEPIKIIPKIDKTKDIAKLEKDTNIQNQNAAYTIQVYSSPSLEDAQDWVKKLKSYNIDAYISEQMIRDVKWYRVRFGNFSTREEARSVALRYGFSQTWIDRIK
jgi:cell division septation protein DedD